MPKLSKEAKRLLETDTKDPTKDGIAARYAELAIEMQSAATEVDIKRIEGQRKILVSLADYLTKSANEYRIDQLAAELKKKNELEELRNGPTDLISDPLAEYLSN